MRGAAARAQGALELGRYEVAVTEARRAIAEAPTEPDGHALLARGLHGLKRHDDALAAIIAALALAPDREWLHRVRASILLDMTRAKEALAAADEAVRLAPEIANGHGLRARCLNRMLDRKGARAAIQRALAIAPDEGWLHCIAADIELDDDNPGAAEGKYRAALRCDPEDAVAFNNLGVVLQRQGRHEEAALAFKSAVLLDPTLTVAKSNTHAAVKNLTGPVAAGAGIAGLGSLKLCAASSGATRAGAAASSGNYAWIFVLLAIAVGVVIFVVVARVVRRHRAERRVQQLDPQLWEMYEKLDRDHKAGRLS